ncbi:hypothetical protein DFJ73DRAFT_843359 [Zopfochytrium polystomum]|nr:hypothetical protein DFJ73DRAFT_843359 [Zopfochytrium polystomum]
MIFPPDAQRDQFDLCWLQTITDGYFTQCAGCLALVYNFLFSRPGDRLWTVLLVNGLSGLFAGLMQSAFEAGRNYCNMPEQGLAYLMAFAEIFWILFETSTVAYSFMKLSTVITSRRLLQVLQIIMLLLGVAFSGVRIYIGHLRYNHNIIWDDDIGHAHSIAFLIWTSSDFIVLSLLVWSVKESTAIATGPSSLFMILLKSSAFRIAIICFTTIAVSILAQYNFTDLRVNLLISFLWNVKGFFPIILLMDIVNTKTLLLDRDLDCYTSPSPSFGDKSTAVNVKTSTA